MVQPYQPVLIPRAIDSGELIRNELGALSPAEDHWTEELLLARDDAMVWETTKGRPRVRGQTAEGQEWDIEGERAMYRHDAAADSSMPAAGDADDRLLCGCLSTWEATTLEQLGLSILDKAQRKGLSWGEACHCGFRPMNLAGFEKTRRMWSDFCATAGGWTRTCSHRPSQGFPRGGLCDKVLRDRTREMCTLWLDEDAFARRYLIVPSMPKTGGATRVLALLDQRSMLVGCDPFPATFPPQLWLRWAKQLQPMLRKEAARAKVPEFILQHWHVENACCCFAKVLDFLSGLKGHSIYQEM